MAFEINRDDIRHRIYLFGDMSQFSQTWTAQERHDVSHRPVSVSYPEKLLVFVRGECAGCFTSGIKKPRYCEAWLLQALRPDIFLQAGQLLGDGVDPVSETPIIEFSICCKSRA